MDAVKIFFDLLGRTKGERDIDRFAQSIEDAGDEAGKSSKKFDAMSKDTDRLGGRVEEARKKVKTLHEEFQRSGDTSVLGDLRKAQGSLNSLERLQKSVTSLGDAASETAAAGTKMINPYTIGAAAIVGAAASISVGAAVAGLALAGLGGAVIAAGAAAVSGSARVQNAFHALESDAADVGKSAARQLEGPITRALNTLREGVAGTGPSLTRMFASVSPSVERLALGLRGMVENAMPGLEHAIAAAGPVLDKLAQKLPELGESFNQFFESLAAAGPGAVRGLADLLDVLGVAIESVGNALEGLSKAYDWMANTKIGKWGQDMWRSLLGVEEGHQRATKAASEHAMKERDLAGEAIALSGSLRQAASQARQLADMYDRINGKTVSFLQAQISAEQSLADFSQGLKDNGRNLDINTAKGRDNTSNLLRVRDAALAARDSKLADGASSAEAAAAAGPYIARLQQMMRAAHFSEAQIRSMTGAIVSVPSAKATVITTPGAVKSIRDVETLHQQEQMLRDKAVTISAETGAGRAKLREIANLIAAVRSKVVTIAVQASISGGAGSVNALQYSLAHRAMGGPVTRGQTYIVGENGPEIFTAQSSGQIIPNGGAGGASHGSSAGGTTIVNVTVQTGADPSAVIAAIQRYAQSNTVRWKGGVTAA